MAAIAVAVGRHGESGRAAKGEKRCDGRRRKP
jgi:hypothetical protein